MCIHVYIYVQMQAQTHVDSEQFQHVGRSDCKSENLFCASMPDLCSVGQKGITYIHTYVYDMCIYIYICVHLYVCIFIYLHSHILS